jgi:hypothetical protein
MGVEPKSQREYNYFAAQVRLAGGKAQVDTNTHATYRMLLDRRVFLSQRSLVMMAPLGVPVLPDVYTSVTKSVRGALLATANAVRFYT